MIKILLIRPKKAYLPEINIYKKYLENFFNVFISNADKKINFFDFDIIWKFMGFDFFSELKLSKFFISFKNTDFIKFLNKNKIMDNSYVFCKNKKNITPFVIHEYPSLSTGNFKTFKNLLKKFFNSKPNLRIFLNEKIKKFLNFNDDIPFFYRDMGIPKEFFLTSKLKEKEKLYDFIYIGEINSDRNIDNLLNIFTKTLVNKTIILIGSPSKKIYNKFHRYNNIIFKGYVAHNEIPEIAKYARFAINWIPNICPYKFQTSTKLLEYSAMNLKIINLYNDWSSDFEKKNNLKFFTIKNIKDFNMNDIEKYEFTSYNDSFKKYEWENYLDSIKLKDKIIFFYNQYLNTYKNL